LDLEQIHSLNHGEGTQEAHEAHGDACALDAG